METAIGPDVVDTVTCASAANDGSAALCAATVTGDAGAVRGARYKPVDVIVPTLLLPPDTPLTSQVTAELFVPLTVTLNC